MPRPSPLAVIRFIGRSSRRIAVSIAGFVLIAAGLAMLVLPGPGLVVIILGLAVLATEYAWAATMLERTRAYAARAGNAAKGGVGRLRGRKP